MAPSRPTSLAYDPVAHAMRDFIGGVTLMEELRATPAAGEMGALLERLVAELQRTAPPRPHPSVKLLSGGVITALVTVGAMLIGFGSMAQRLANVEELKPRVAAIEAQLNVVYEIKSEQQSLRRDLERYFQVKR